MSERGGARAGAGRPALPTGAQYKLTLDDASIAIVRRVGGGNASLGTRRVAERYELAMSSLHEEVSAALKNGDLDLVADAIAGRWERPTADAAELPAFVAAHIGFDENPDAAEHLWPGAKEMFTRLESLSLAQRVALIDFVEKKYFPSPP
jgi:hypothetical protein